MHPKALIAAVLLVNVGCSQTIPREPTGVEIFEYGLKCIDAKDKLPHFFSVRSYIELKHEKVFQLSYYEAQKVGIDLCSMKCQPITYQEAMTSNPKSNQAK